MKDFLGQYDVVEIIFAIGIVVAGVYAMYLNNQLAQGICLGAAATYIKGKTASKDTSSPN
ncbi:MAG: hypothetical protein ABSA86_11460 [Oryzomonas sp.]